MSTLSFSSKGVVLMTYIHPLVTKETMNLTAPTRFQRKT